MGDGTGSKPLIALPSKWKGESEASFRAFLWECHIYIEEANSFRTESSMVRLAASRLDDHLKVKWANSTVRSTPHWREFVAWCKAQLPVAEIMTDKKMEDFSYYFQKKGELAEDFTSWLEALE